MKPFERKMAILKKVLEEYEPKKEEDFYEVYAQAKVRMDFNELTHNIKDLQDYEAVIEADDFSEYYGRLTRAGPFKYLDGVKYKNFDNLKDIFSKTTHLPVFGSKSYGSHKEGSPSTHLVGFATNWDYNVKDEDVFGDVFFFKDIGELSDLKKPDELPVSIKFDDTGEGDKQNLTALHHLAVSLNKLEDDRCGLTGNACTISQKQTLPKTSGVSDSYDLHTATAGSVDNLKSNNIDSVEDMSKEFKKDEETQKNAGKPTPDENEIGKEIDSCASGEKDEVECKLEQRRKERSGKYEESQDVKKGMSKKDLELSDITLEDLTEIIEDYEDVVAENKKLKEGSKALLDRLDSLEKWQKTALELEEKRKGEELIKLKEDLLAKGVGDTFLENRSLEQLQDFATGLEGLDKSKFLESQAVDTEEEEEITATSLADMGKTIDDVKKEYDYLKMS